MHVKPAAARVPPARRRPAAAGRGAHAARCARATAPPARGICMYDRERLSSPGPRGERRAAGCATTPRNGVPPARGAAPDAEETNGMQWSQRPGMHARAGGAPPACRPCGPCTRDEMSLPACSFSAAPPPTPCFASAPVGAATPTRLQVYCVFTAARWAVPLGARPTYTAAVPWRLRSAGGTVALRGVYVA